MEDVSQHIFDEEYFLQALNMIMPFGKYKGQRLIDLPEEYLIWFERKGFPPGKLGEYMQCVYAMQVNGLENLQKLRSVSRRQKSAPES